jgi:hypothetical protein
MIELRLTGTVLLHQLVRLGMGALELGFRGRDHLSKPAGLNDDVARAKGIRLALLVAYHDASGSISDLPRHYDGPPTSHPRKSQIRVRNPK